MRETRSKGNFTGGFIIYGYKVENHKVVIDEEKAVWDVRMATAVKSPKQERKSLKITCLKIS